jgi:DNA replication protein DnaC
MPKLTDAGEPCSVCGGSGWRRVDASGGPRVTRCGCFLEGRSAILVARAGIPPRYLNCEFSTYNTNVNASSERPKFAIEKWANQYPLSRTGLLIAGESGLGKTHLAVSALKQILRKGVCSLFCDYRELLKQIQDSYNPSVETAELEILRPVMETEVLLLDDLGAVRPSQWVFDTVSVLLNARYNGKLTTIITTNFTDKPAANPELPAARAAGRKETLGDRIGDRMRSRLAEMCSLVVLEGEDYRQRFRQAGFR